MYFLRKSSKGVVPFSSALCRVPVCAIFLPLYSCVSRFFFLGTRSRAMLFQFRCSGHR